MKQNTLFAFFVAYLLSFRRELQVTGGLESKLGLRWHLDWQESSQTAHHDPEPRYTVDMN